MNIIDYIIIAVVVLCMVLAVVKTRHASKSGCCGSCTGCHGCAQGRR